MTDEPVPPVDDPHDLLTSVRDLTRQVRLAQRGTWFPLLVFGIVTLGSIPGNLYGGHRIAGCRVTLGPAGPVTRACGVYSPGGLAYWVVALVLAYVAIAAFYVHQARQRGVGTRIRPYVVIGVVIAVLVPAGSLWFAFHPSGISGGTMGQVLDQLRGSPVSAIGLALLVLAWVERNRALAWFSLGYLIVVLIPSTYFPGIDLHHPTPHGFLPRQLIIAGVLLLGSLAFALTRPAMPRDAQ